MLLSIGCSKDSGEKEAAVPVQVVTVQKETIQRTVTAEAILFPLQQSAITPKISAPVKAFYIKRGSHVHKGQLLAVLENGDLEAAAQENKGSYDQAQAAYETTTASDLPQEVQKAKLDAQGAKELFDAQQKIYNSRQELFQQGALPRKELDQAGVDLTNARNQYEIAQKHLDALMKIGKQQQLKSAAGQLESAKGKYMGAAAQLSYSEIRSPIDGVVADRPLYPGEMAAAGNSTAYRHGCFPGYRPRPYSAAGSRPAESWRQGHPRGTRRRESGRRHDHRGQPGPRSQQHHGRDLGAGEEFGATPEAGHQRATLHAGADDSERAGHSRRGAADRAGRRHLGHAGQRR